MYVYVCIYVYFDKCLLLLLHTYIFICIHVFSEIPLATAAASADAVSKGSAAAVSEGSAAAAAVQERQQKLLKQQHPSWEIHLGSLMIPHMGRHARQLAQCGGHSCAHALSTPTSTVRCQACTPTRTVERALLRTSPQHSCNSHCMPICERTVNCFVRRSSSFSHTVGSQQPKTVWHPRDRNWRAESTVWHRLWLLWPSRVQEGCQTVVFVRWRQPRWCPNWNRTA